MEEKTKQAMINDIVIDDGSKTYKIKNKQGKVLAEFSFRPSDTNIISRYKEVEKFFKEFKIEEEDPDIKKYENEVIEQMDYLVNADTAGTFFGIMGAFSPMPDGTLFYETCINAVCNVINAELDTRLEKIQSRTGKYTDKYRKPNYTKKHRYGK